MPDSTATSPPGRAEPAPAVAYTTLHHELLEAVHAGAISLHPGNFHRVLHIRVNDGAELGLVRFLFAGITELADERDERGDLPVLLTPLGTGVLWRWFEEHPGVSP